MQDSSARKLQDYHLSPDTSSETSINTPPETSTSTSTKTSQKTSKSNFKSFLNEIRQRAKTTREKGEYFEIAIKDFLKQSPEYSFENVWLRADWPDLKKYEFLKKDLGIDLIAREKETGIFWAIQCKCFDESYQVNKADIDSFFTESGKNPFKVRLIVTTTTKWGANAEEALKNQTKECKVLDLHDLEQADFEWSFQKVKRKTKKKHLREHQVKALRKSAKHFEKENKGKLIMACGTGKTFTSLRIVEKITPKNANVLFLAPSISLISQTLREYAWQRQKPQRYLAVCSDTHAGKDTDGYRVNDLQISPTTNPERIAERLKLKSEQRTVVFSTYQSLNKIKLAQTLGAPEFDLVICDEAHRTTGVEAGEGENGNTKGNYFTRINDPNYVKAKKRLYMTATPRIYSEGTKNKARKHDVEIHSMDDEAVFGKEIYRLDFSKAIEKKLLADYKVIILSIDEQYMSDNIQEGLKETDLSLNDASRLVGCYKALRDQGNKKNGVKLKRAVGFLNTINNSKNAKEGFQKVVNILDHQELMNNNNDYFTCETEHIDGTDSSIKRNKKLDWLKEDIGPTENDETICRILMNSKCLTEGIDVPSLDAVMFLHPRKSQVDVVQAVGRIMRKQEGKKYGYVILPVVIPSGKSPEEALDDNQTYKVVWQVLNALRSHDSSFNAIVNNLELNKNKPAKIKVIGVGYGSEAEEKEIEEKTDTQIRLNLQQSIEEIEEKVYAKIVEKCGDRIYEEKWTKEIEKACKTISTRIKSLLKTKPAINKEFQDYHKGLKGCINEDITEEQAISMLSEHLITRPAFDKIFENYQFSENNPISKTMKKVLSRLDEYGFGNELKDLEQFYQGISRRLDGIDNSASRQKVIKELYENFIKTAFPKTAEKLGVAYTPVEIVDFILKSANEILKDEFKGKKLTDEGVHVIDPFVGTGTFLNRLIQMNPMIEKKDLPRKFKNELHANDILLLPYYVASINIEEAYHSRMKNSQYTPFPKITLSDIFNRKEKNEQQLSFSSYFQENNKRIKEQQAVDLQVIIGNPPYSAGQKSENDANKNTIYPKLHKRIEETYVKESTSSNKNALYDSYIKAIRWATDEIKNKGGIIGFVHNASLVSGRSIAGLRKSLVKEFDSIYCINLRGNQRTKGELSRKEGGKVFGGSSRTPIVITFLVKNPDKKREKTTIKYLDIGDYLSREEKLETIKNFGCIKGVGENWQTITPDKYGDWLNQRDDSFYQLMPMGDKKSSNQNAIFDLYSCGVATSRDAWVYNFDKNQVKDNMKNMIQFYNQEMDRLKDKALNKKNIDNFINRDEKKISWSDTLKRHFIARRTSQFQDIKIRKSNYRPFTKNYLYFDNILNERHYLQLKIFPKQTTQNKVICVSGVGEKTFSVLMTDVVPCGDFLSKTQCFPLFRFDDNSESSQKSLLKKESNPSYSITDNALNRFKNHYKHLSQINAVSAFQARSTPNVIGQSVAIQNQLQTENQTLEQIQNKNIAIQNQPQTEIHTLDQIANQALEQTQNKNVTAQNQPQIEKQTLEKTYTREPDQLNQHQTKIQTLEQAKNKEPYKIPSEKRRTPDSITKEDIFYYIYALLHSEDYRKKFQSNLDKDLPRIPLVPEFWKFSYTGRKLADLHLNYENQPFPKNVKVLKDGQEINIFQNKEYSLQKDLTPEHLKVRKMKINKKDKSKIQFNDHITISNIPPEAWEYKINGWPAIKWIVGRYQYKKDKKTDLINDPNTYSEDPAYILKLLLSIITVSLKTKQLVQKLPTIDFKNLTNPTDTAKTPIDTDEPPTETDETSTEKVA